LRQDELKEGSEEGGEEEGGKIHTVRDRTTMIPVIPAVSRGEREEGEKRRKSGQEEGGKIHTVR
jgi:hypothetical protein